MKTFMIAIASVLALSTAAYAFDRPAVLGYGEYAVEAETVEIGLGTELAVTDSVAVAPVFIGFGDVDTFDFDRLEVTATYNVSDSADLYVLVETDNELAYSEATVGVQFSF